MLGLSGWMMLLIWWDEPVRNMWLLRCQASLRCGWLLDSFPFILKEDWWFHSFLPSRKRFHSFLSFFVCLADFLLLCHNAATSHCLKIMVWKKLESWQRRNDRASNNLKHTRAHFFCLMNSVNACIGQTCSKARPFLFLCMMVDYFLQALEHIKCSSWFNFFIYRFPALSIPYCWQQIKTSCFHSEIELLCVAVHIWCRDICNVILCLLPAKAGLLWLRILKGM